MTDTIWEGHTPGLMYKSGYLPRLHVTSQIACGNMGLFLCSYYEQELI